MRNSIQAILVIFLFASALSSCSDKPEEETCTPDKIKISVANVKLVSNCNGQDGSFTVLATEGTAPYSYSVFSGFTNVTNTTGLFSDLFPGKLKVTVKDKNSCSSVLEVNTELTGTSPISFKNDITPILKSNCTLSGCHNGDLDATRDWRSLAAIQKKLNNFQLILSLRKMPPPPNAQLSAEETNKILCWIAYGAPDN
jgi:hypothetical protein